MNIQIKTYFYGKILTETIDAEIIGELAVYQLGGLWTIGHILSGAWIAAFTHKHVAVNLAKRIMSLYSIDYCHTSDDTEYRVMVGAAVKNWCQHVAYRDNNSAQGHCVERNGSVK